MNFDRIFSPRSIALLGASKKPEHLGARLLKNLLDAKYGGHLYPVNPNVNVLSGLTCYTTLGQIGKSIDLALLTVPADSVIMALKECAAARIPGVVVLTPDNLSTKQVEEIKDIALENKLALFGPNSAGYINTDSSFNLNGSIESNFPQAGSIGIITQRDSVGKSVLESLRKEKIGVSKFINLGDKQGLTELDCLAALRDDSFTKVIVVYVEEFSSGAEFLQLARQISCEMHNPKPILVMRSGLKAPKTKSSLQIESLVQGNQLFDSIFNQSGVLIVDSLEELLRLAHALSAQPLPKGNRVSILSSDTGGAKEAQESTSRLGLEVASVVEKNVDEGAIKKALKDPKSDSVLAILSAKTGDDFSKMISNLASAGEEQKMSPWTMKPFVTSVMGYVEESPNKIEDLHRVHIPNFQYSASALRALKEMNKLHVLRERQKQNTRPHHPTQQGLVRKILDRVKTETQSQLTLADSLKVISAYGLPVLPFEIAKSEEEAIRHAKNLGYPVSLRLNYQYQKKENIPSNRNCVDATAVSNAFRKQLNTGTALLKLEKIVGVLIQNEAKQGTPIYLGAKQLTPFGPVVALGYGGEHTDVFQDVAFRMAPLGDGDIDSMIDELKSVKLIKGKTSSSRELVKIRECLQRLSQLMIDFPEIEAVDVNPFLVYTERKGVGVVEGRVSLGS